MCADFHINCLLCWRGRRLRLLTIFFSSSNGWSTCNLLRSTGSNNDWSAAANCSLIVQVIMSDSNKWVYVSSTCFSKLLRFSSVLCHTCLIVTCNSLCLNDIISGVIWCLFMTRLMLVPGHSWSQSIKQKCLATMTSLNIPSVCVISFLLLGLSHSHGSARVL